MQLTIKEKKLVTMILKRTTNNYAPPKANQNQNTSLNKGTYLFDYLWRV